MRHEVKISPSVLMRLRMLWNGIRNYLNIAAHSDHIVARLIARDAAKEGLEEYFDQIEEVVKQNPIPGDEPKPRKRKAK